ncbi:MAG: hypothetical protein CMD08_04470 [Flavobacteriales bacterium]|nr:hypothetical protein [Flavobacteriales bacterium]
MKKIFLFQIFILLCYSIYSKDVIIIDSTTYISNKQALVILNGFGSSKKNIEIQNYYCIPKSTSCG